MSTTHARAGVRRTVIRTLCVLVGMVGFTLALIPLYDVFCEITGLNGKTANSAQVVSAGEVDESREVRVQLVTRTGTGLSWQLQALDPVITVHPGEISQAMFRFSNRGDITSSGKAVPSITPSAGAEHFRKMECFCFQQQSLMAGETLELPLVFQIAPDLPEHIETLTLAYSLYPGDEDETVALGGAYD
ncbi:cytochrome c oxidase assembly protein [Vreelandella aquamarina]|uniref:cytochrome c oxidase assembly protein n=1 Tax=Vreelandella aquamarina TaxID=77097 RepID=UPI00119760AB|nr:cytochrome c oxidase assembly protein [Halomonas sp.]TVM06711.1 MAG: cytochrome c oxidase assembly protein [Halomonas sp.]